MSVILHKTVAEYVAAAPVTATVVKAAHVRAQDVTGGAFDGIEHHQYRVRLTWGTVSRTFAWHAGMGHDRLALGATDPTPLFDALLSDWSTALGRTAEKFAVLAERNAADLEAVSRLERL